MDGGFDRVYFSIREAAGCGISTRIFWDLRSQFIIINRQHIEQRKQTHQCEYNRIRDEGSPEQGGPVL